MNLSTEIYNARVWFYRRRTYGKIDSIKSIKNQHPDFDAVRDRIRAGGTDSLPFFGNGYTHEGGLYLQQNPDEFAALCLFLRRQAPYELYLEIGSASGGACLFLHRELGFNQVISLDDGQHPRAPAQEQHFSQVKNFKQFLGDSHSDEARRFLEANLNGKIDLAFIDGDHSYQGVWQDVQLVLPFCRRGSLIIFHDTIFVEDVRKVWLNSIKERKIKPLAEFVGEEKPLGIGVGEVI